MNDFSDKSNIYINDSNGCRILLFESLSEEDIEFVLSIIKNKDLVEVVSVYSETASSEEIAFNRNENAIGETKNTPLAEEATIYEDGEVIFHSTNYTSNLPGEFYGYFPELEKLENNEFYGIPNSTRSKTTVGSPSQVAAHDEAWPKPVKIAFAVTVGIPASLLFLYIFTNLIFPALAELIYIAVPGVALLFIFFYTIEWIYKKE